MSIMNAIKIIRAIEHKLDATAEVKYKRADDSVIMFVKLEKLDTYMFFDLTTMERELKDIQVIIECIINKCIVKTINNFVAREL